MSKLIAGTDHAHHPCIMLLINLTVLTLSAMFFSKSFGYAVRGILYVMLASPERQRIHADEIATALSVPRHFSSKVMKKLVKQGVIDSVRGPHGGFSLNGKTAATTLFDIVKISGDDQQFTSCALRLKNCNSLHPCPLHYKISPARQSMLQLLQATTMQDLLHPEQENFLKSLSVA